VLWLQNKGEIAGIFLLLCTEQQCRNSEKWLKLVYIHRSYRKIKTGMSFLEHSVFIKYHRL